MNMPVAQILISLVPNHTKKIQVGKLRLSLLPLVLNVLYLAECPKVRNIERYSCYKLFELIEIIRLQEIGQ